MSSANFSRIPSTGALFSIAPGRALAVVAGIALAACQVPPATPNGSATSPVGNNTPRTSAPVPTRSGNAIDARMQSALDAGILPGGVIMVIKNDQTVYQRAFGFADLEAGRRHTTDGFFYLGSTSKPLATTGILALVDKGTLKLTDSAANWFTELSHPRLIDGTAVRPPRLDEMLSHTSGIYGNATATPQQQRLVWNYRSTLAATAPLMASQPLIYPPGEGFSYGGAAMSLVGRIAEIETRSEFDQFAEATVFAPLGMSDSFYRTDRDFRDRFAVIYQDSGRGLRRARFQAPTRPGGFVLPPGGIISTAADLAKFLQMHLHDGRSAGRQILSEAMAREMRRDRVAGRPMDFDLSRASRSSAGIGQNDGYGLGWMLDELDADGVGNVFFHGGAFGTLIWADYRSQLGIVLLTHVPLSRVASLWDDIIRNTRTQWGDLASTAVKTPARPAARKR